MKKVSITAQMVVKNEERWVGYAIRSVLPHVDKLLIFDTGSTDRTVEIIEGIKDAKIVFEEKGEVGRKGLVKLRKEQLRRTRTEWFLLVDGDEIWPGRALKGLVRELRGADKKKLGIVTRTRNCVGDVWHYMPESEGEYEFFGQKGHFNLRAFRKVPGLDIEGEYPMEVYTYEGKPLNEQEERLELLDDWYLHVSHLPRSSVRGDREVMDRMKKYKLGGGIKMEKDEMPEVLMEVSSGVEQMGLMEKVLRLGGKFTGRFVGGL